MLAIKLHWSMLLTLKKKCLHGRLEAISVLYTQEESGKELGMYVVKEALTEVRESLEGEIDVNFAWVKFLLCWSHSGPGYYAGINIAKN